MLECYASDNGLRVPTAFAGAVAASLVPPPLVPPPLAPPPPIPLMTTPSVSLVSATSAPPLAALRDMTERRSVRLDAVKDSDADADDNNDRSEQQFSAGGQLTAIGAYGDLRTAYLNSIAPASGTPHGITDILGRRLAAAEAAARHAHRRRCDTPPTRSLLQQQQQNCVQFPGIVNPDLLGCNRFKEVLLSGKFKIY